jgi:hypothetical protein
MRPQKDAEEGIARIEVQPELGIEAPSFDAGRTNLLDRLLYKAVLPKYAFPTDVAAFYVFDNDKSDDYNTVFKYAPSQGLAVALTSYAPGKRVTIDQKEYTSGAVYSILEGERRLAWKNRLLYFECSRCRYAITERHDHGVPLGRTADCPACGTPGSLGPAQIWMRPPGFAHPSFIDPDLSTDDEPARSIATKARLSVPSPHEPEWTTLDSAGRVRIKTMREHLLVTNRGPKNEGYRYCLDCGLIEPVSARDKIVTPSHRKPYPDSRHSVCRGSQIVDGLVLGTDFISDILLISVRVDNPVTLRPGILSTEVALRTLSDVLATASCSILQLEPGEIRAEFRPALTPRGQGGTEAEIYLYDTLPGGAGFTRRIGERGTQVFERAADILRSCNCDRSCYHCLRSFKNKYDHDFLDRHVALALLDHVLTGNVPILSQERSAVVADLLFEDLSRNLPDTYEIKRNAEVVLPGFGTVVCPILIAVDDKPAVVVAVTGALTPTVAPCERLDQLCEYCPTVRVLLRDEIVVRRNLPSVTQDVLSLL